MWSLLEDSQFPPKADDLPEVVKFASLWATNDPVRVMETRMLWVLVEMDLYMVINQRLRLSPTIFEKLEAYVEFKVNFHSVSICVRKDPKKTWYKLSYLVSEVDP